MKPLRPAVVQPGARRRARLSFGLRRRRPREADAFDLDLAALAVAGRAAFDAPSLAILFGARFRAQDRNMLALSLRRFSPRLAPGLAIARLAPGLAVARFAFFPFFARALLWGRFGLVATRLDRRVEIGARLLGEPHAKLIAQHAHRNLLDGAFGKLGELERPSDRRCVASTIVLLDWFP